MKKTRIFFWNLLILLITIPFILFLFEGYFRFFNPQLTILRAEKVSLQIYEPSNYTPWKLKPNTQGNLIPAYGNEYDVPVKINSIGLRDYEINQSELTSKSIIEFIGDSFTFGYGVYLEDTYHKKIESMLNKDKKKFRTINLGFADGAYTTDIQYLYLKEKWPSFNPKIVVLGYYVGNDILDFEKHNWTKQDANLNPLTITSNFYYVDDKSRLRKWFEIEVHKGFLYKMDRILSKYSHIWVFLKRAYIGLFLVDPVPNHLINYPEGYNKNLLKSERMLNQINKLTKSYNTTLIVLLIPTKTQILDSDWEIYKKFYGPNVNRFNPQYNIITFCKNKNIRCIDLLPEFLGKKDLYFKKEGHWNEKGHALAAQILYEYLVENKLVDVS